MEKTEHVENCGQVCGDGRFELIDKIKEDIIRTTNITKDEEKVLSNILFRLWQRDWLRNSNDIDDMEAKVTAYDRLMSGGLTMKELANTLGKPVAIDAKNRLWWFPKKPEIGMVTWIWYDNQFGCFGEELPRNIITFTGDWKDSLTLPDGWEEANGNPSRSGSSR